MKHQTIAVLDFGSQYTQVIARRIRECNVYSKIYSYKTSAKQLEKDGVIGVILSGGPSSVLAPKSPQADKKIFSLGVPVLGICYGVQLIAHLLDGKVEKSKEREYGHGTLTIARKGSLFRGLPNKLRVWNSHGDRLAKLPSGFAAIASTENSNYAAIADEKRKIYGIQFHPEVDHSEGGINILENFLRKICGCKGDWSMADLARESIENIRKIVGKDRVLLGLSGGVDSSVAAALIHKAIGRQLTCVFVDNGLLRLHERELVVDLYKRNFNMDVRVARAGAKFLTALKGVTDPEKKRKIIGKTFVKVFQDSLKRIGDAKFLAQGTLYPDVIESIAIDGNPAATIKSHHNVGGLPKSMKFKLLEPLRELFKDEVRALGTALGLPKEVVWRQPFPGPGLGVRVLGEINKRNLDILRKADAVLHEEMMESELYYKVWQSFCVFLPVRTVGVMGDERTYDNVIALRIVESKDAMTADWSRVPYEVLQRVSTRIINEVEGVNRVVYDLSSKPPGTIEWE
ncbi:glutamine-hydrolyzing GMP synthase [Pelagicoccus sp. SDUM812005]|uniref:glutamine-hydrolyzing GMP synthase n=1 Tax=Pelagicoccus sp. SDUM812005 TaxID=3041257 RepID=UPI00280EBDFB|nr:glutamine-hydrolyzing GMP synthase [Pelagicoccus sp. SDUM812005]MDQ8183071.1 glutamine-hydrolyzing GMP synthase [Pelagicoccus sp. SDUM812005]